MSTEVTCRACGNTGWDATANDGLGDYCLCPTGRQREGHEAPQSLGGNPGQTNFLKEIREKRSLSLADVARMSGVSKAHVHQLEQGTTEPSLSVAVKIAAALAVPVSEIWIGADNVHHLPSSDAFLGPLGQLSPDVRFTVALVMLAGTEYSVIKDDE